MNLPYLRMPLCRSLVSSLLLPLLALLLAGCQAAPMTRPAAAVVGALAAAQFALQAPVTASIDLTEGAEAVAEEAAVPEATPAPETPAAPVTEASPVTLTVPALGWSIPVVEMGWEAVLMDGVATTRWLVPADAGGWAVNSAVPGAMGNMIIMGQQALGSELFRPLALGDLEVGQAIEVTAADGKSYLYTVTETSVPIPAIGATAEEEAEAGAYLAPGGGARLTLVTGWPADVTTHRIFVVAAYDGEKP